MTAPNCHLINQEETAQAGANPLETSGVPPILIWLTTTALLLTPSPHPTSSPSPLPPWTHPHTPCRQRPTTMTTAMT